MVKDKINYRALGPRTALTRQTVSGRANDGGLRIGEMERDAVISHGITDFLRESMMERGDKYHVAICNTTGMLAIYNPAKDIFMSPMADGPVKFVGSIHDQTMNIENITKFGRDFSVICIPYTMKLFMQELQTMNIQMRIITEDNIEQLENMTFSKNIDSLTFRIKPDIKNIIQETKKSLTETADSTETTSATTNMYYSPKSPTNSPPDSPSTTPRTPPSSPLYIPSDSPSTTPRTPPPPSSPLYIPSDSPSTSPRTPPPPPPPPTNDTSPSYGGMRDAKHYYTAGTKVHYRGDNKAEREWRIKNVGDKFLTIFTKDTQGLDDNTKVVQVSDVYPLGHYYNQPQQRQPLQYDPQYSNNMMYTGDLQQYPAPVNFALKIINNGNDQSVGSEPLPPNAFSNQQSLINSSSKTIHDKQLGLSSSVQDITNDQGGISPLIAQSNTTTGDIDFGNLQIRKL
jgi:hypothetical protein